MLTILCALLILVGLVLVIISSVSIFKKTRRTENVERIKISSIIMIISGVIIFVAGVIFLYFLISGKIILPLK